MLSTGLPFPQTYSGSEVASGPTTSTNFNYTNALPVSQLPPGQAHRHVINSRALRYRTRQPTSSLPLTPDIYSSGTSIDTIHQAGSGNSKTSSRHTMSLKMRSSPTSLEDTSLKTSTTICNTNLTLSSEDRNTSRSRKSSQKDTLRHRRNSWTGSAKV